MPKPKTPILDNKNNYVCPSEIDSLLVLVEDVNFLCRANEKVQGGYSINKANLKKVCEEAITILKKIKNI